MSNDNQGGYGALGDRIRPPLSAAVPHGWFSKSSMTFLSPDGQANIIVSEEPLDPTITVAHYTQVQGELLSREFPQFRQAGLWEREIDGLPGPIMLREFSWAPPDGVPVTQVQLYAVVDGDSSARRGITATGTTPSAGFAAYRDLFFHVLYTIAVTGPAAPEDPSKRSGRFRRS